MAREEDYRLLPNNTSVTEQIKMGRESVQQHLSTTVQELIGRVERNAEQMLVRNRKPRANSKQFEAMCRSGPRGSKSCGADSITRLSERLIVGYATSSALVKMLAMKRQQASSSLPRRIPRRIEI